MKSGVVVSTLLHALVLTWGLWSLSAPEPLEVADVQSLPVDLVPIESLSQSMVGEKDAPKTDKPAPAPTEKPQTLPMPAENVGDNEVDLPTPPTPVERPKPTEEAAAAPAAAETPPEPDPAPVPEPTPPPPPPPPCCIPDDAVQAAIDNTRRQRMRSTLEASFDRLQAFFSTRNRN